MKKLNILYEDKQLIVVYKEPNLPTIKSNNFKDNLYSQVYDYLHKKNQKVFVVHRLDKDTSGLVLFAKNEMVKDALQRNWDSVKRIYIAIVHGKTKDSGIIKSYLKETKTLLTYSTNDKSGKYAETEYKTLMSNNQYSLLELDIKTGRKNQIRVHMKDNNTPILGDRKYGIKDGFRHMMLLAKRIEFIHPVTHKTINIDLEVPGDYLKHLKN
ncbi:MAG: RluA family pseudouridine synthase [Bacilli bacterium]|nr:RluA family pseudouridine synthase [Bacilli bacterium]